MDQATIKVAEIGGLTIAMALILLLIGIYAPDSNDKKK